MADTFQLVVRAVDVAGAVLVFAAVTGVAALGPAIRAARLQPVTAIQRLD
jgi:ABC-type antimicrobial peptide transport system permease subunit